MFYNDSRRAALRLFKTLKLDWVFNTSSFTGNMAIALLVTYFFRSLGHGDAVDYVFFLSVLAIGLWITEAIPPFAVGVFLIGALLFGFGTDFLFEESAPPELYVGTWTSNVVWLLLGGFFLAKAMSIVQLDRSLFRFTVKRFGQRPERLLLGLMMTTALASMVMSNTATTAMMISSIVPLVHSIGKEAPFSKALLTGIPAAASVGGVGTIIGSTPNAIAVGALSEVGIQITFVEWMAVGFPVALILVFLFWQFLIRRLPIKQAVFDLSPITSKDDEDRPQRSQRIAVIVTLIVTVSLWLTEPIHGIPVAATSAVPIVFLTLTQVINAEHVRSLPWDTLMLVAGGLALGIALVDVGLSQILMDEVFSWALPLILLAFFFSLIGVLLSNVMSNTAASSILIPLSVALPAPFGIAVPVIVAICCSSALMLPVSTPSNAISFGTGLLQQRDFYPGGIFLVLVSPLIAIGAAMLWSLFYL
ncbi:MAG: DASS family sodium-coupled anion symporter [Cryomorphaceae bacterium]|nr:MAG: DASS family sodium-coupled anion symporter [Cryomorphaceae bacterium]